MTPRRRTSLAGAVYRRVVALVAVAGLLMAALAFAVADRALDRSADDQLVTATNVLLALMGDELAERAQARPSASPTIEIGDEFLSSEDARAFHAAADWRMFAVFERGRLMLRSDTGPPSALLPHDPGFHDFGDARSQWRSYGLAVPRFGLVLIVGEALDQRHDVLTRIAGVLALPLLALIAAAALLLCFSLRSGLFDLRRLSAALSARSSNDLERFDVAAWPTDLSMLLGALNRLFARLDEAFAREQRLTDEAAHQLRTPLAAIKVRAQALLSTLPPGSGADGTALLATIDRTAQLSDRLLLAARVEATAVHRRAVDLRDVAIAVVGELVVVAALRDIDFAVDDARTVAIATDTHLLGNALGAICENAIKYAPRGSIVEIATAPDGAGGGAIIVSDRGPGIPPADRERAFERFTRLPSAKPGAGLGLAIARRAVDLLGGGVTLGSAADGIGLVVRIALPAAI